MARFRPLAVAAAVAIALAACTASGGASRLSSTAPSTGSVAPSVGSSPGTAPAPASLTIYGAASLKAALAEAKAAYERANPGTTITISTDSSAALETQIEQGAPADVFLSADTTNPTTLVAEGLAAGVPVDFARNRLTVIVPTANPARITGAMDLAKPGVKVVAAADEVPITRYAKTLLANLARESGYPADFVAKVTANIVSKEDNVKAVVAKVELGEGDAGIVYETDAKASSNVLTVPVPDTANVPATYAGVVVKASKDAPAARAFLDWFAGPGGQAILASFGFLPPS